MDERAYFQRVAGVDPYAYQERLLRDGLPELLHVPTGAGKTMAVLGAWLWRRFGHPDEAVRHGTPRWLVYVLPMRVLVEQVTAVAKDVVARGGLSDDVWVHTVMGGDARSANAWREHPERCAIFVGTQDMLLSRALNRAYGESRFVAPIDFGMFNSGCHWVFDEVQLMGAALPTSRQLEGLRRSLGTAQPCTSTWMSATVELNALATVDLPHVASHVSLTADDHVGALATRLDATRRIHRLDVSSGARYADDLASVLLDRHRPGTRTIAFLNTVTRAVDLYTRLLRQVQAKGPDVVLVHSRFRPPERAGHLEAAVHVPLDERGRIVVTTQVLEAGVDVTSTTLFTEAAPWSSVVQRAGRCNRDGAAAAAEILWCPPPNPLPYDTATIEAASNALRSLEAADVTAPQLAAQTVAESRPEPAVLRRRDLVELFDTTPDLAGNEVDVSRFIRDVDEMDVQVAWRELAGGPPQADASPPSRDELCSVPVGGFKGFITGANARRGWRFDPQDGEWLEARSDEVRPGRVFLLDAARGGYQPELGWKPDSRGAVPVLLPDEPDPQSRLDDAVGSDFATFAPRRWVSLVQHLADAERDCADLFAAIGPTPGLSDKHRAAACLAARLHDIGKAHPVFQATLAASAGKEGPPAGGPWAKSGGSVRARHERRHFRHELVSALLLLDGAHGLLEEVDADVRDLVVYLVAAHHGRVRLGIRSLPDEPRPPGSDSRFALGVWEGDEVPAFEIPGANVASTHLDLGVMTLGEAPEHGPSWTGRALSLRDSPALGVFRLAFLEAVVRLADWRASAEREEAP